MDCMSRSNRSKAKRLGNAISKLEQEQGGSISQISLCTEMHLTEAELAGLQQDVREVRLAKLPEIQKKVLAMYYHENRKLSEIAACFGLTESRICQIHTQTVGVLRNYLASMLA
jgi:RNA polymerase sigma factor (sigma-70 family)